jgi:hypothetical protein
LISADITWQISRGRYANVFYNGMVLCTRLWIHHPQSTFNYYLITFYK